MINKNKYVGKEIQLFPVDAKPKYGIIRDVDLLGFTVEITKCDQTDMIYKVGTYHFISHHMAPHFVILNFTEPAEDEKDAHGSNLNGDDFDMK